MTTELDKLVDKLNAARIARRKTRRMVATTMLTSERYRRLYMKGRAKLEDGRY